MPPLYPNADAKYTTEGAGGEVVDVRPGDVIWCEPGERHWHGAAPDRMMAHLAVQRADEAGRTALWLAHVTNGDYTGEPGWGQLEPVVWSLIKKSASKPDF